MSMLTSALSRLVFAGLVTGISTSLVAQTAFAPSGIEYRLNRTSVFGDQVNPSAALGANGGYLAWEDNVTDGDGQGVSFYQLDANLVPVFGRVRLNLTATDDQRNPKVTLLKNGGAAFVWQSHQNGSDWDIYAAFVNSSGAFVAQEVLVNSATAGDQLQPSIACMADGNVMIVWESVDTYSDGVFKGVYGRVFSPSGVPVGDQFLVAKRPDSAPSPTIFSQHSPSVAALANGNTIVVWVSETQPSSTQPFRVDVLGRILDGTGAAVGASLTVNTNVLVCANPTVAAFKQGGFAVAWAQLGPKAASEADLAEAVQDSWDVFACTYYNDGSRRAAETRVNQVIFGDQYSPTLATVNNSALVAWTSLGQDGSMEGVYARELGVDGQLFGSEFLVNTTTERTQQMPALASDGTSRVLAIWSGFTSGGSDGMDLYAQGYQYNEVTLAAPSAPFVSALDQTRLALAWPPVANQVIDHYEVSMNQSTNALVTTNNFLTVSGLSASSTNTFVLYYVLGNGRRSPASPVATGVTWGNDVTGYDGTPDGLPDDWERLWYGSNRSKWPSPYDPTFKLVKQAFLAGTSPLDKSQAFTVRSAATPQGLLVSWNTQTGLVYQLEMSGNLKDWTAIDQPRFARSTNDSLLIQRSDSALYFRVNRIR